MASKPLSPLAYWLAKAAITLAAFGLFCVVRPDVAGLLRSKARTYFGRAVWSRVVIAEYIRSHPVRKLQLGAGSLNRNGWLNTDIDLREGQAYLDVTKHFPIPDASMHFVTSEHLIEHIPYEDGLSMLRECHRVLASGGRVRIATPNLSTFLALFQDPQPGAGALYIQRKLAWHRWPQTPDPACLILNRQMREWGHEFLYTPKLLRATLESAGFSDIRQFSAGQSDTTALTGLEARSDSNIEDANAYETMVFEGLRR